jgi:hypothetical protein
MIPPHLDAQTLGGGPVSLTRWFRRNSKYLMAGTAVLLMIAWGVVPALGMLRRPEARDLGRIRGEKVREEDIRDAASALRVLVTLGFFEPLTAMTVRSSGVGPGLRSLYLALVGHFGSFVFTRGRPMLGDEEVWRFLVLSREAEAAGIGATPGEARDFLTLAPPLRSSRGLDPELYTRYLATINAKDAEVTRWTRQVLRVLKLLVLRSDAAVSTPGSRWMLRAYEGEQARIRYVEVPAAAFAGLVGPSEEDLRAFYEEHRETTPDPATGAHGYMAPERVRLEYAVASATDIASEISISDDEIAAYYEEHKDEEFVLLAEDAVREQDQPGPETGHLSVEAETAWLSADSPDLGPAVPAETGYLAPQESPGLPGAGPAVEEEAVRYRSLGSVREEIRAELTKQRSLEEARSRAAAVVADLRAAGGRYGAGAQPLAQMARRHGLTYIVARAPDGGELLSREQVAALEPGGRQMATFAFAADKPLNFATSMEVSPVAVVVCQVLEWVEARPLSYEEAAEQVRADYTTARSLDLAEEFAQELRARAVGAGLAEAAAEFRERLGNLLGEESGRTIPSLEVRESGLFRRSARRLPGSLGLTQEVVKEAFSLGPGELGTSRAGGADAAVFVLETIERVAADEESLSVSVNSAREVDLWQRQAQIVPAWMQSLLAASEPPPPAEPAG